MNRHRLGPLDLLLVVAVVPALTGHFWVLMSLLAVYAVLYHRVSRRHRR